MSPFEIRVGDLDPDTLALSTSTDNMCTDYSEDSTDGQVINIDCNDPSPRGRYMTIRSDKRWLTLCEVYVFGNTSKQQNNF